MPKKDWKAEFKKLTVSKGTDALKMEITPYRDWRIVVIIFFIGIVASLGFNIYLSIGISSDSFFTTEQKSSGVLKFDEEGLTKVIDAIDKKAAQFEKIRIEGVAVVDPSL